MFADWSLYFWPQITSPWVLTQGVFNLPWLFLLLQILRPLGKWGALIAVQAVGLYVVFRLGKSLGLSTWRMALVACSPPVIQSIILGQFDGLFLAAFLLSPWAAVFLALCKPQVAICAGVMAALRNKWAALFGIGLVLSAYLVWGWPVACLDMVGERLSPVGEWGTKWNWSIWPCGLLFLPLFFGGRRGRLFLSPLLFPYVGVQSFVGVILAVPGWLFLPLWAGMWVRWIAMLGG